MGISWFQILVILVIVVLIFGTKKLRNLGGDLGGGLREFKKAMKDGESEDKQLDDKAGNTYDAEATTEKKDKV